MNIVLYVGRSKGVPDMQSRYWILALLGVVVFPLQSTVAANAQEAIGKATSVKPQADGSHGGDAFKWCQRLFGGDDSHWGFWSGGFAISRQQQSQCRAQIERPAR